MRSSFTRQLAVGIGFLLLVASPVTAQAVAGKVQPDSLPLGVVREGSVVEASVRVFADGKDTTGVSVEVKPPPFVRVLDVALGTQEFGRGPVVYCDVTVAIDTGRIGEHSGTLAFQVGNRQVKTSISISVTAKEPGVTRVLVVDSPFHKFSTDDSRHFDAWLDVVKRAKLDVDYWMVQPGRPVLREKDLGEFDVILLSQVGLIDMQKTDLDRLKAWLENGGRVIVSANAFFVGTIAKANELLIPYGLIMNDVEPPFDRNTVELTKKEIADHPLTAGVKTLYFFRPSPTELMRQADGKHLVSSPGSPSEGIVTIAKAGKGEVITLGASLWCFWISGEQAKDRDNAVLLRNLLTKPRARP